MRVEKRQICFYNFILIMRHYQRKWWIVYKTIVSISNKSAEIIEDKRNIGGSDRLGLWVTNAIWNPRLVLRMGKDIYENNLKLWKDFLFN